MERSKKICTNVCLKYKSPELLEASKKLPKNIFFQGLYDEVEMPLPSGIRINSFLEDLADKISSTHGYAWNYSPFGGFHPKGSLMIPYIVEASPKILIVRSSEHIISHGILTQAKTLLEHDSKKYLLSE